MGNKKNKLTIQELPKELENATLDTKKNYAEYVRLDKIIVNHELRYYTVIDRHGEGNVIDCIGVWSQHFKGMDKMGVKDKADYDEVKRRCKILHSLKIKKGHAHRKWSNAINKGKGRQTVFDFRKGDILEEFGRYKSIDQVHEIIKEWGFVETRNKVMEFYWENKDEIQERRLRFAASEKDFYLSSGTGRIEALSHLYVELMEIFNKTKSVKYASEIRAIIEQVRKEIKGDEIRLTVDGKIDITATVQANRTLQELNQKMPINMMIVSLVAAKRGLNPMDIMSQLSHSFYSNYNGFNSLEHIEDDIKLPSHLINEYDWNSIREQHQKKEDKATKQEIDKTLGRFFKEHGVNYTGDSINALKMLESKMRGEVVPEIVDIEPIEVDVENNEEREKVKSARERLKEILKEKSNKVK
jgi:hypothetical protein